MFYDTWLQANCRFCFYLWSLAFSSSAGSQLCFTFKNMELLILVVVLGIKHLCPNALMYHSLNPSSGSVFSHLSIHACMHVSFYPASSIHVALLELFKLSRYITLSDRTYWETNPCSTCELETTVAEYSMKVVLPDTHGRMCQLPPL